MLDISIRASVIALQSLMMPPEQQSELLVTIHIVMLLAIKVALQSTKDCQW